MYVLPDAQRLEATDVAAARAERDRARRLLLRARDYGLARLPSTSDTHRFRRACGPILQRPSRRQPLPTCRTWYWIAAAWGSAISNGKGDMDLLADVAIVDQLIRRAETLDERWDDEAIHEFLIAFESRGAASGGSLARARDHFTRAMALNGGRRIGPLVTFAESVGVQEQRRDEFDELIARALAFDVNGSRPHVCPICSPSDVRGGCSRSPTICFFRNSNHEMSLFDNWPVCCRSGGVERRRPRRAACVGRRKIATIAPAGSPWHDVLVDLAERWRVVSHGTVQVKIFAGGVQGDEAELVRKMRIGLLQGGSVTTNGLDTISSGFSAFSIPLLFRSYGEVDYVRERIAPRLARGLTDRGFVVLHWGDGGWVRFFTTRPARSIEDVKTMRIFTWAGNSRSEELWKQAGFRPVPLAPTDILTSLQAGLIEGCPVPATAALAYQWFGVAKYMLDVKIAPIVGATVITAAAWGRIDPALRPLLIKEAEAVGARLRDPIRRLATRRSLRCGHEACKWWHRPPTRRRHGAMPPRRSIPAFAAA